MVEFNILKRISYNNKDLIILTSKKYPIYILEVIDKNKYIYPSFDDFIGVLSQYRCKNTKTILNLGISSSKLNNSHKKLKLIPKVMYKGLLVSLTTALLMSGCGKSSSNSSSNDNYREQLISECDELGYDVYFSDYNVPFLHEGYCEDFGGDTIFCKNLEEFKNYLSLTGDYTYDDIRECFKNNKDIPNKYKKFIFDGLDKMEEKLPDLDLCVLYYNAKRMKFVEADDESLLSMNSPAWFDISSGEVCYDSSFEGLDSFTFCHEVLGHGSMECATKIDNKYIYYGFYVPMLYKENEDSKLDYYVLGMSFTEASADVIGKICSGKKPESVYQYAEEELRLIGELCSLSNTELFNSRGLTLLDKMHKNNIDDPSIYLLCSDEILDCYRVLETGQYIDCPTISAVIEEMVIDATEEDVSKDNAIANSINIMNNCNDDFINLYYYDSQGYLTLYDYYDHYESSIVVEEQLNDIKKKTKSK